MEDNYVELMGLGYYWVDVYKDGRRFWYKFGTDDPITDEKTVAELNYEWDEQLKREEND